MKKIVCLSMLVLLCVGMFAGCSKDKPEGTENQGTSAMVLGEEKITAENVSPYDGPYLEYSDREMVSGICAVLFTNTGDATIQDAQLIFSDGNQELTFNLEMLPAGQSVVVAEYDQCVATGELQYVDGVVNYLEAGLENSECVKVTGNADGTVMVENITKDILPLVRVFYRPADAEGNPLGGPCKSFMIDGIEAGASVQAEAEGWDESCVVVTVLVINE